jgi:hypothetical protein
MAHMGLCLSSTQPASNQTSKPESTKTPAVPSTSFDNMIELVKTARAITQEPAMPMPPAGRIIKKAKCKCPTKIVGGKIVAKNKPLDPFAVNAMNTWYLQHANHPYPSDEEKEQLGNISVTQVKSWFFEQT